MLTDPFTFLDALFAQPNRQENMTCTNCTFTNRIKNIYKKSSGEIEWKTCACILLVCHQITECSLTIYHVSFLCKIGEKNK